MKRTSTHELLKTPSHLYQRLLRGEINSKTYTDAVKRMVDMRMRRDGSR